MAGAAHLPNPRKILALWCTVLIVLAVVLGAYTVLLHGQVQAMRENSPWTYLKQAETLRQQSNIPGALRALEKAAELGPHSPVPHERAGLIHYDAKEWEKSLASYQRALELGTQEVDPRGKIIWCLIRLERHAEAAAFGEACIRDGRSNPAFHRYVAEAFRRAGNHEKAIQYYEAARRHEPHDIVLMQHLVELYTATGAPAKAETLQQRITDLESSS